MAPEEDIVVREAQNDAEREAAYQLRYRVFVEGMSREALHADHTKKTLHDPLDKNSSLLVAVAQEEVVGTIRVTFCDQLDPESELFKSYELDRFDYCPLAQITLTSHLAIDLKWKRTDIAYRLFRHLFRFCLGNNIIFNLYQCFPSLVRLYEKLGYRRYTKNLVTLETGYQVPLIFVLRDVPYLQQIGSPLLSALAQEGSSLEPSRWLEQEFGSVEEQVPVREFWKIFAHKLLEQESEAPNLFEGFSEPEIQLLFHIGTIRRADVGDFVVKQGDPAFEMYVVLSGEVEVHQDIEGDVRTLAKLGTGHFFGDMALFLEQTRSATVQALEPTELLVLSKRFLQKVIEEKPQLAARLLYNISRELSERLHVANLGQHKEVH